MERNNEFVKPWIITRLKDLFTIELGLNRDPMWKNDTYSPEELKSLKTLDDLIEKLYEQISDFDDYSECENRIGIEIYTIRQKGQGNPAYRLYNHKGWLEIDEIYPNGNTYQHFCEYCGDLYVNNDKLLIETFKEIFKIELPKLNVSQDQIYVISTEDGTRSKVGVSKHPDKRLKELQTGSPFKLELKFTTFTGKYKAYDIEKMIHALFDDTRTTGEWFTEKAETIIKKIKSILE